MEDRQWLKSVAVVSSKHGLAAVRGFGAVCGDEEEEAATVSHAGRRNEKGEDLGSEFSPATPPVVAGVDDGVSRQPRDVQW
ncbi:hypothetical protein DEO72_LG9g2174 [Vigna unguiculata]|uniref:Uncharacterized protein n=1 Tax=Vigna unguiculata TaxID=3917 RepID=A0A4D6N1L0_VIGUN|nr:hypothetical protein DEO72_LG9g2174 [Vigna unguiculata]